MANINKAITQAQTTAPYGGVVQFQPGTYAVSSTGLTTTTIGNSSGAANNWTYSGTAPSVGQYVLSSGQGGNAVPQVLSVGTGTFTTDLPPLTGSGGTSTINTGTTAWFITPAIVIPPGVKLQGTGGSVGLLNSHAFEASPVYSTGIIDSGTGITILSRGGQQTSARYGVYDMAVWAKGTWSGGTTGTVLGGIYIGNASLFFETNNVDCNYYTVFGFATDANTNQIDLRNGSAQFIGTSAATASSGAYLASLFNSTASESFNLYNCMCSDIYGMGVGGGNIGGSNASYAQAVNIWGGQYQNCFATSATYSGYALVLGGNLSNMNSIVGVWCGTNANGDLWWNTGVGTALNCTFTSQTASVVNVWSGGTGNSLATLTLDSCQLYGGNSGTYNVNLQQGTLNWRGIDMNVGNSGAINSLVGNSGAGSLGITQQTAYGTGTATTNSHNGTIGVTAQAVALSNGKGYQVFYDVGAGALRYLTVNSGSTAVLTSLPT